MGDEADAAVFVNTLYRKVLLCVKASNAIPSEDDGFHFHSQFSAEFASLSTSSGAKAESLVRLLTKRQRTDTDGDSRVDSSNEDEMMELFDGPEPNAHVTDYADMLLDEASKHLARFGNGETETFDDTRQLRPLENKPHVFEKKKEIKKNEKEGVGGKTTTRGAQEKPQDRFDDKIDNTDAPFVSKLREKVHALNGGAAAALVEEDETGLRHPYFPEIEGLKYAPWQLEVSEKPYEKVELEEATYMWVDSEEKLMQMMKSLITAEARVIAVDLEHHSYRSYMGLTCLMQISTAHEDFLVDTLVLRGKLEMLNQIFCDPEKVKVLHGSDMDILWLQRDLGLYVVNLFDTGRAARLLQYPRFSLAYMLKRHCNVDADKQYQLADWRTRPLDKNMVKYAREDTRYLLFIYDRLKERITAGWGKPHLTEEDALAVGEKLKGTVNIRILSDLQKRVIMALYEWRDHVARQEDESVAYVMPNHVLMKLTKHLPVRSDELFRACHPVPSLIHKIWNEDGEEQLVSSSSSLKRVGRADYAPWKSGQRKAGVTKIDSALIGSSSSSNAKPMALAANISSQTLANSETAATLLDKVNAMVASTMFTIAESERVKCPVSQRTSLSVIPSKNESTADDIKPKIPQSISETYHTSNRSKRQKTTPVNTSAASQVKERAQSFMQKDNKDDDIDAKNGFQGFDYAGASNAITAAKFQLKKDEDKGWNGGHGYQKKQVGYNPFVAMKGTKAKNSNESKAQVKKMHHMPRSATFQIDVLSTEFAQLRLF
ncbi:unnamed protein product [Peronospora destructor]|uniref:HRDC domain-containing protein n=1 Tax=Peronospora destructor TaxID=86335 RepID=A0AAV0T5R3_9STRA|nr:unnamed protein product [Peronospora destructor]